jgi:hypothetical protein
MRIKDINSQIDNMSISDSMKSRLKSNLIIKFNNSSLNWNISSSEDIHNLIELSKLQDRHWYDMFTSPYFYIPFIASTFVTGCYFFPEYTIYPILSYFGIPVNQTWEEIWRWFLDRGPQPPDSPSLPDPNPDIEVNDVRSKSELSELYNNIRKNRSKFLDTISDESSSSSDSYITASSSFSDSSSTDSNVTVKPNDSNVIVKPTDLSHPLSSIIPLFTYFFQGEKVNDRIYNNPVTDFSDTIFEHSDNPSLLDLTEKFVNRKRNYFSDFNYEEWDYWLSEYHRSYFYDIPYDSWIQDFLSPNN